MSVSRKKTLTVDKNVEFYTVVESEYKPSVEQEAIELFEKYKNDGWIVNCEYSSEIWYFKLELDKPNTRLIKFDIDMFKEHKAALKAFAMFEGTRIIPSNVQRNVNYIKAAILATNGFNEKYLTFLEDEVAESDKPYDMAQTVIRFISFINHPLLDEIESSMSIFKPRKVESRKLIVFRDLLLFGHTIDIFQQECSSKEKLIYYPIILWWRITNIIPLRTKEFIDITRNCLKKKNNKFFIILPREKQQPKNKRELPIEDEIPISESIYNLIYDYIQLTDEYGESKQLLSTQAYVKAMEIKNNQYNDYWHSSRLRTLLDKFYNDIVVQKYGNRHDIQRLKPMDTRHYAFMNLKLQGFNELTIARMGGHKTIKAQMYYTNHMEEFADSYVYCLTKLRRFRKHDSNPIDYINESHPLVIKSRLQDSKKHKHKYKMTPYGICTYDLESNGCPFGGECRHCWDWFYLSEAELKDTECLKWLGDHSRTLGKLIREKIAFMKEASKGMEYDFSNLKWFNVGDEELRTLSRDISSLMLSKSVVDSFLEGEFYE
ncbi:tyrosine-type recombinase/integrase [Bacillus marasmi]|uniref:tyrosine-type recombinase/integrase n=1 Tax=Bacillus marasmi TaxID=1926279 RepID=UPI0011CC6DC2|nr:tyrosine-type recombinase/integrase [Bacillus marasmi]